MFVRFKKQWEFWLHLAILIILAVAFLLSTVVNHNWIGFWESLPPLPNGETARDFTDVLPRNRINVITDQGHYFSCPYDAEETCWVAIPREVNTPQSKYTKIGVPMVPWGTRRVVHTYSSIDSDPYLLSAVILEDGRVAIWTQRYNIWFTPIHFVCDSCCGILFLVSAVEFVYVIRHMKDNDPA